MKRIKKITRIKWKNVAMTLISLVSLITIIHDFYKLAIEPFFTGYLTTLTWFGAITLLISFIALDKSYMHIKSAYVHALNNK